MRRWVLIVIILWVAAAIVGGTAWYVRLQSGPKLLASAEVAIVAKQYDKALALGASYAAKYPDDWRGYEVQARVLNFKGLFESARQALNKVRVQPDDDMARFVLDRDLVDTYAWPARQALSNSENLKSPEILDRSTKQLQQADKVLQQVRAPDDRRAVDVLEYAGINMRLMAAAQRNLNDHYSRAADADAKAGQEEQRKADQQLADEAATQAQEFEKQTFERLLDVIRRDPARATAARVLAELAVDQGSDDGVAEVRKTIFSIPDPVPDAAVTLLTYQLQQVLQEDPLLRERALKEVTERVDDILLRHGDHASACVLRAELAMAHDDSATALRLCDGVLQRSPRNLQARLVRSRVLMRLGKSAQAERELFALKTDWANSPRARLEYAQAALVNGRRELAREAFQNAIRLSPGLVEARRQLGIMMLEDNMPSEAFAQSAEILRLAPNDRGALTMLVEAAARCDRTGQAKEALANAAAANPDNPDVLMAVYDGYTRLNARQAAEAALQRAAQCRAQPGHTTQLAAVARALASTGRVAEALRMLDDELEKVPDKHRVHFELGGLYLTTGKPLQAVAHLREALSGDPQNLSYKLALCSALISIGQLDEAQQLAQDSSHNPVAAHLLLQIRILRGQQPDDTEIDSPATGLTLAASLLHNGQPQRCVQVCQAQLKAGRDEIAARTLLAQAYVEMGQTEEAVGELSKLVAATPQDWSAYARLAAVLLKSVKPEELSGKLAAIPNARSDLMDLTVGFAYLQLGRNAEAAGALAGLAQAKGERWAMGQAAIFRAQALYRLNQPDQALAQLKGFKDNADWGDQASLLSGDILLAGRRTAEAQTVLEPLCRRAVERRQASLLRRIASLYAQWRQYGQAEAIAAQLIAMRPNEAGSYVAAADIARAAGHGAECVELYRKAIETAPANASLYMLLAAVLDEQLRRPEAIETLRRLEGVGQSEKAMALFERGRMLARWGLAQQALETYRQLADSGLGDHPRLKLALGDAMASVGDTPAARKAYCEVPVYAPQYVPAQQRLAALAQTPDDKLAILQALQATRVGDVDVLKQEMDVLISDERAAQAVAVFNDYAKTRTGQVIPGDLAAMAVSAMVLAGDREEALALASAMASQTRLQPWRELAALLAVEDQPDLALRLLGRTEDLSREGAMVALVAAMKQDDAATAAACLTVCVSEPSTQPQASAAPVPHRLLLALVHRDYDQAAQIAGRLPPGGPVLKSAAVELVANARTAGNAEAAELLRAVAAIGLEQPLIARTLAQRALDRRPSCQWAAAMALVLDTSRDRMRKIVQTLTPDDSAQALMLRAIVLMEDRKLAEAAELYGKAADTEGGDMSMRLKQAQTLDLNGQFAEALQLYQQVYGATAWPQAANAAAYMIALLYPQDQTKLREAQKLVDQALSTGAISAWRDTKGYLDYLQQRPEEACAQLRAASRQLNGSPELHYHLGAAEAAAGRIDLARWHLSAAVQLCRQLRSRGQYVSVGQQRATEMAQEALAKLPTP